MEKIKDALAKAKVQKIVSRKKVSNTKRTTKEANTREEGVGESAPAQPEKKSASKDIEAIAYTHSSVIELNAKHLERNRIVSNLSHNANASVFNSLRTQVLQKMEENNWQTIAIVSPTPESGKTFVSINLAMAIAHQPQKTALLVDFDLRKPKVASYLGIDVKQSLNEYFQGEAEVEDIMVNPDIQRLTILPTMRPIERSAELLSSNRVKKLINELKGRYEPRVIVFDLPPLLSTDDAMVILPQVDCVLLVVANGASTSPEIEQAMDFLPKEKLIGVVYNKAEEEQKAYYY